MASTVYEEAFAAATSAISLHPRNGDFTELYGYQTVAFLPKPSTSISPREPAVVSRVDMGTYGVSSSMPTNR